MGIHGVDAGGLVTLANMVFLTDKLRTADKVLSY